MCLRVGVVNVGKRGNATWWRVYREELADVVYLWSPPILLDAAVDKGRKLLSPYCVNVNDR